MNRFAAVLLLCASLTGCGLFKDVLTVKNEPIQRPTLVLPDPEPVQQMPVEWSVITKDNLEVKVKELEAHGGVVVLFAITPEGYQNLSLNGAELRRYIQQQKAIIGAMKQYYETPPKQTK